MRGRLAVGLMPLEHDTLVRQGIHPGARGLSLDESNPIMHYLYILLLSNGDLYKGITDDLKRRFREHNLGKVRSTKNYLPTKLVYYETYLIKSDCLRREKFLKTNEGRNLLKKQLRDMFTKIRG